MKMTRTLRIWGGFLLLLLLLLAFLIWNIFAGSVSLSASEIWRILLGGDVGFTQMSGRLDSMALITPWAMPSYGVRTASSFSPWA